LLIISFKSDSDILFISSLKASIIAIEKEESLRRSSLSQMSSFLLLSNEKN